MKTLTQLIAAKKFNYVNSDITEERFPVVAVSEDTEYKVFHFDRYINSEEVIAEMEKEGYRPANISELLSFEWDEIDWVVALGSVAEISGDRDVPILWENDARRGLNLNWWDDEWSGYYRFLAVRNSLLLEPKKAELGGLDSLTLALKTVRAAGYIVKPMTLAKKFENFQQTRGNGRGNDYWQGLADIAEKHFAA